MFNGLLPWSSRKTPHGNTYVEIFVMCLAILVLMSWLVLSFHNFYENLVVVGYSDVIASMFTMVIIHPAIIYIAYLVRVRGKLKLTTIPVDHKAGNTLSRSPIYRTNNHSFFSFTLGMCNVMLMRSPLQNQWRHQCEC